MMGYLDAPKNMTEYLAPSGWLNTGDVVYYGIYGFLFTTDRLKERIKVCYKCLKGVIFIDEIPQLDIGHILRQLIDSGSSWKEDDEDNLS